MKNETIKRHMVGVMEERRSSEAGLMEISRAIDSAMTAARALLLCAQRANDKGMLAAARRNLRKVEAMKRAISGPELWTDLNSIRTTAEALYRAVEA